MKDTLRLILFLQCNMKCSYCCNEQEQFSSQFIEMWFRDIDFSKYKNVCLSGGEPFLRKSILYSAMYKIPRSKQIFIYTNGLRINNEDIKKLKKYKNLTCLNIGLHTLRQLSSINRNIDRELPVRFMVRDINYRRILNLYPDRLNESNLKAWTLNECNMPNEDWVLLKDLREWVY